MLDRTGRNFVIAHQSRKDGKPGSIGRRPCVGPLLARQQIPCGSGVGVPCAAPGCTRVEQFVEPALAVVEHEHVPVAARVGIAFNRRIGRDRHRAGIALVGIGQQVHSHGTLAGVHDDIRDTDLAARIESGAEVGMNGSVPADKVDEGRRIRIHGRSRDVLIPQVARRERHKTVEAAADSSGHLAAGAITAATTTSATATSVATGGRCRAARGCDHAQRKQERNEPPAAHGCLRPYLRGSGAGGQRPEGYVR